MWSRSTKQRRAAMRRRQSRSVRRWMLFLSDSKWTDIDPALRWSLDLIRSRLVDDAPPPDWCPLRVRPVLVRLVAKESR